MNKEERIIFKTIKQFANKLPKFPDGRIDYSRSDIAPVIIVFLKYDDKILLLKRSKKVSTYKEKWNSVAGYLDELKPLQVKALEEIKEELGVDESHISLITIGKSCKFTDIKANKTWIICPVLAECKKEPDIKLDWEHTEYKWVRTESLKNFDTIPHLAKSLENVKSKKI